MDTTRFIGSPDSPQMGERFLLMKTILVIPSTVPSMDKTKFSTRILKKWASHRSDAPLFFQRVDKNASLYITVQITVILISISPPLYTATKVIISHISGEGGNSYISVLIASVLCKD